MVRNQAWPDVIKRIASHPEETMAHDPVTGDTVLHICCQRNPPAHVVRALGVHRVANHQGATALHTAVSHRCSAEVMQVLLEVREEDAAAAAGDDENTHSSTTTADDDDLHTSQTADLSRMGRAPIHYACMSFRGLDMDAFRLLVDATLRDGNVWVRRQQHVSAESAADVSRSHSILLEGDEEHDDEDNDNHLPADPTDFLCEFGTEENRTDLLCFPSDDLTTCDDDYSSMRGETAPVLVNVMGLKDATGQTPLSLLFRRYRERVRCVINTVDRLRTSSDDPNRASLVAAIRVHADLGELWEKARYIIAKLTEERLQRERWDAEEAKADTTITTNDATSRRATYFGTAKSSAFFDPTADPPSPGATAWAVETHSHALRQDDLLPLPAVLDELETNASTMSTVKTSPSLADEKPQPHRKFRIVHASVGLTGYGCPPELIRLAISIHPHQVMEMDEDGNLPIHIAATAASYLATAHGAVPDYSTLAAVGGDDASIVSALSFFSSATVSHTANPFDKVIKILLQHYPSAARIPHGTTGRLPLVMAIASRRRTWADGVETLLHAYPPALHHKKVVEPHLFPHVLARVGVKSCDGNSNSLQQLLVEDTHKVGNNKKKKKASSAQSMRQAACARSTLYQLIRTKPEWVTRGFVPE